MTGDVLAVLADLLDHAQHLLRTGDDQAAEAAIGEAGEIGQRLRCRPLLDRADAIQPAAPHTTGFLTTARTISP